MDSLLVELPGAGVRTELISAKYLEQSLGYCVWNHYSSTIPWQGHPRWLIGKESAYHVGDTGLILGSGRFLGEENGNPLQYSCLENPHGQRSLAGYSPWGRKESDLTEQLIMQACYAQLRLWVYTLTGEAHTVNPHYLQIPYLRTCLLAKMYLQSPKSRFAARSWFSQRRQWQPTPVILPGKSHGWRSLIGCSPWGC